MSVGRGTELGNGRDTRRGGPSGSEKALAPGVSGGLGRREAAEYIAGLLNGLKEVADTAGLTFLTYLLAMALEEAQAEKSREQPR